MTFLMFLNQTPNQQFPVSSRSRLYLATSSGVGWLQVHLHRSYREGGAEPVNWGGLWCWFFRGGVVETQGDMSSVVMFIFFWGWILSSK